MQAAVRKIITGFPTNLSFSRVIGSVGLQQGLKLCFDAGDSASYDPAVQTDKWLDTSGNGTDFYRGSGTGSDAADPTFNGSANARSLNEYWSSDGGDYLTIASANPAWIDTLHKTGAIFSIASWVYVTDFSAVNAICGPRGVLNSTIGAAFTISSPNGNLNLGVGNGTGSPAKNQAGSANAVVSGVWSFASMSITEATGANGLLFYWGTGASMHSSTYSSPSSSAASNSMQIGAAGNANNSFRSGSRIGMIAIWQGVAHTRSQLEMLYQRTRGRFRV